MDGLSSLHWGNLNMNSKTITYAAVIVMIVAVLSAAFIYVSMQNQINALQTNQNSPSPSASPTATPIATPSTAPTNITIVDDEGYVTILPTVPNRVVSVAPSNTQIMFAIGAGDKIVGLTDYDNYPYNFSAWIAAGNMTSIGGYSTPNKETIVSLNPDLILATKINDADVVTLRGLGLKVLVLEPKNVANVMQDISLLGRVTNKESAANTLISTLNAQIDAVVAKIAAANVTAKPTVYYEIWWGPAMSVGKDTWVNDIITKAGGVNLFGNLTDEWPTVSSETIASLNPDVIVLPTSMGWTPSYGTQADVIARPGWSNINAVKNNRIAVIDGDLFAEVGPRVAEQVQTLAKALYPNLFP
jgi:iron complex transport system substrate-binding protein